MPLLRTLVSLHGLGIVHRCETTSPYVLTLRHCSSALATGCYTCVALCHQHSMARRDIKPENVFFDDDDNLRLGDFGLAIDETRERPTARVGTLDFMAPEARCWPVP